MTEPRNDATDGTTSRPETSSADGQADTATWQTGSIPADERVEGSVPDADDPRKPGKPTDLSRQSWRYLLRKTVREFLDDQCTDLAAGLTYYSVLAIFPALLALLSLLGVVGQADKSVKTVLDVLAPLLSSGQIDNIRPVLEELASSQSAGLTLILGLLGALWSASAYVGGFSRAMNRIYEVGEGRPVWKLRPMMLVVTVISVILCALSLVILIVSGPVARSVGDAIGLGDTAVTIWNIAKWPVLALVVILVVAVLYYATPNVRQPKFRWISLGAFVAIVIWLVASAGFAFYVANFSSYNKTYGSLAGAIVALLWLWLTNVALLFGAELDAELERARQLQAGMAAEEEIQLPVRDARGLVKAEKRRRATVGKGRELREAALGGGDPHDRPFGR